MLRRTLLAPALLLAVLASAAPVQDPTVYKTKTGEKYHRDGCSSLRKSKIAIRLSEAKAQGLGACLRCKPPK